MTTQSITSLMGLFAPFTRKRNRYLQSRESFYEGRNYLSNAERLKSFVSGTSTDQIITRKPIKFYGLEFGTSVKEATSHLGKPNYTSKKSSLLSRHKTIYYRINIAQVKCILQLHFLHDEFFLGLIEIRSFGLEFKKEVADLVRKKYNIDNENWEGKIVDDARHKIELKNNVVPYIVYQSGNSEIKESIRLQLEEKHLYKRKHYDKRSDLILEMI
ncbi:MAG: hypothetical protein Roseis2KO_55290 [Roseivirga sp.]